jgi:FkbM family methyltransferase
MATYFDIGANDGDSTLHFARAGHTVWAFEPHPGFCDMIRNKSAGLTNYTLVPKAVSDFDGQADFHVYRSEDCSSLAPTVPGHEARWPHMRRGSMDTLGTIRVEVIRLSTFMRDNRIRRVDWLHCDAQGHDLRVLRGLGDCLCMVAAGVVECVSSPEVALYEGHCHRDEVVGWLESVGLRVDSVANNDPRGHCGPEHEVNVFFSNPRFGRC